MALDHTQYRRPNPMKKSQRKNLLWDFQFPEDCLPLMYVSSISYNNFLYKYVHKRCANEYYTVPDFPTRIFFLPCRVGSGPFKTGSESLISTILSVPKFTANLSCISFSIDLQYTKADAAQICGNFWDTQYVSTLSAVWTWVLIDRFKFLLWTKQYVNSPFLIKKCSL